MKEKSLTQDQIRLFQQHLIREEKSSAMVTNTYTNNLIQTGQLNWPIPVLCVLGAALVGFGLYLVFKKRDDTHA